MSPNGFDMTVFGSFEGDNVWVGVCGVYALYIYDGCVHSNCIPQEFRVSVLWF